MAEFKGFPVQTRADLIRSAVFSVGSHIGATTREEYENTYSPMYVQGTPIKESERQFVTGHTGQWTEKDDE